MLLRSILLLITLILQWSSLLSTNIPITSNILSEKKIVVIIPSYNNALYYEANLRSVLSQDYSNYHIIYVDDCSPDGTGDLVEKFIINNNLQHKITLIRNAYNRKALANVYRVAHICQPSDLILEFDGDDTLAHNQVLKKINQLFTDNDIWLAYAQYMNVPEEKARESKISIIGYARETPQEIIDSRDFRTKWLWSGLRMYYAWLFQQIKLEDLFLPCAPFIGKFFPTCKDGALFYPMLEMAGHRIKFIPEVFLLRNIDTPINDFKIVKDLQRLCESILKKLPKYDLLSSPLYKIFNKEITRTDLIIFADYDTQTLFHLIDSCQRMTGLGTMYVFYYHQNRLKASMQSLQREFINVKFIELPEDDTLTSFLQTQIMGMHNHIVLAKNNTVVDKMLDLNVCVQELEKTYAYAFYLRPDLYNFGDPVNVKTLPCEQIYNDIFAWKFNCAGPQNVIINNFNMTLYRKQDVLVQLAGIQADTVHALEKQWQAVPIDTQKVGLFFASAYCS